MKCTRYTHHGPNALQRFAPRGHRRGRRTAPISGPSDPASRSYPFSRPSSLHTRPTPRAHGPPADPAPCSTLQPRAAREGRRRSGEHSTRPRRRIAAIRGFSEHAASPLPPGKVFAAHSRASYEAQVPATTHRRQHARPPRHIALSVPTPHNRFFPLHASPLITPHSNLQHQPNTKPFQKLVTLDLDDSFLFKKLVTLDFDDSSTTTTSPFTSLTPHTRQHWALFTSLTPHTVSISGSVHIPHPTHGFNFWLRSHPSPPSLAHSH
jgi:hypothetical protein